VMRILNAEALTSHGNLRGRRDVVEILEAGLQAADPYNNTKKLIRVEGNRLIVGGADYEPTGSPVTGDAIFDLTETGRILVVGAGKGVQHVAKAIEEALGDRLTGGHVIAKHGDDLILERIGVTFGAHPVPDEGCVIGCQRILELLTDLHENDLVFTIAANGISSLLTLPVPGVTLEEVRETTYLMQIDRGAPTGDLNPIRNHLDQLKGGRISTRLQPATAIHILAIDPGDHDQLMHRNVWLHTLPEGSTFAQAVAMLKKWDAWEAAPASVRAFLERADPRWETVKADTFEKMSYRIFGVMPNSLGVVPTAMKKAAALGYRPIELVRGLGAEASQAGLVVASIATTIERCGIPFEPPCALFTSGELLVTVGQEKGIGGRNQEYAMSAALRIAGSPNIVVGAVDTDGTDGPGTQFVEGCEHLPSLAGGVVDGSTYQRACELGIDLRDELRHHNTTPALCRLDSGVVATHNISLNDLCVTLIMDRTVD
jgi:glycerate 2-kinase